MIAVAPLFFRWKIGLSTHTESRCDAQRFIDASKAACGVQFTVPVENPDIGIPKSASCKGESSMFALPDSRLAVAIQDEDLTYV